MKRLLSIIAIIIVLVFAISLNGCISAVKGLADNVSAVKGLADNISAVKGMTGGGEKKEGAVNIDALTTQLEESFFGASKMLGKSVLEMAEAVGNKELALGIQAMLDEIENNKQKYKDNPDALKEKVGEFNNAADKLKEIDIEKEATSKEAGMHVGKGLLYTGVGISLDSKAADNAKTLINVLPGEIKANPLKVVKLKKVLSLAKMVATEAPKQMNSMKNLLTNLTNYATLHKIAQPTAAELYSAENEVTSSFSESDFDNQ